MTSKAIYEGRATERCGLDPTPSVFTALSLERAPTGKVKQSMSASNQSINDAHLVRKAKTFSVFIWPAVEDLLVTPAALERLSSHA